MNTRLSVAVAFIFKKLLLARIGWLPPCHPAPWLHRRGARVRPRRDFRAGVPATTCRGCPTHEWPESTQWTF